jgi:hypothetical protein
LRRQKYPPPGTRSGRRFISSSRRMMLGTLRKLGSMADAVANGFEVLEAL